MFLNAVETFKLPRYYALKYGRSYRVYVLGMINLNTIRAPEVEVMTLNSSKEQQFSR